MYSEVFKNSLKLLASSFLAVMLRTFFTRRALKGKLDTQRALQGHSKSTRRVTEHSGTPALEGHLGTEELKKLGYSGTRRAFKHSGNRGSLLSRLDCEHLRLLS